MKLALFSRQDLVAEMDRLGQQNEQADYKCSWTRLLYFEVSEVIHIIDWNVWVDGRIN